MACKRLILSYKNNTRRAKNKIVSRLFSTMVLFLFYLNRTTVSQRSTTPHNTNINQKAKK